MSVHHGTPITIGEKIKWSKHIYSEFKTRLLSDRRLITILNDLREAIAESRRYLELSGISRICAVCDKEEGGSCCGKGIEKRYSPTVLLINLLLGAHLPEKSNNKNSCLFLTPRGCSLIARDTICINYICKKIEQSIPPETLYKLREKEGTELEKLFLLNEYINTLLMDFI